MKIIRNQLAGDYPAGSIWRLPSGNLMRVYAADVRSISGHYVSAGTRANWEQGEPVAVSLRFMKKFGRRQP